MEFRMGYMAPDCLHWNPTHLLCLLLLGLKADFLPFVPQFLPISKKGAMIVSTCLTRLSVNIRKALKAGPGR